MTSEQRIRDKQLPLRQHGLFPLLLKNHYDYGRDVVPCFSLNGWSLVKKPATCTRPVSPTREWSHATRTFREKNTEDTPPRTADLTSDATKYVYSTECAINHRSVGNWCRGTGIDWVEASTCVRAIQRKFRHTVSCPLRHPVKSVPFRGHCKKKQSH